jgi:hypothetical protein
MVDMHSPVRPSAYLTIALILIAVPANAQGTDSLPPSATDSVANGVVVLRQQPVDDTPWPRVRLYRFIDATPEQSAAMFADFEHQRTYVKNLDTAIIARRVDPAHTEVTFRYAAGIRWLPSATYTVLECLERVPGGGYRLAWTLVSGEKLKHVEGSARFTRWRNPATGRDGTLLVYDSFVIPSFRGAGFGFVRNRALDDMRGVVDAIAVEVERERASDRVLLDRQLAALRAVLGS